jgi:hypothetical protein
MFTHINKMSTIEAFKMIEIKYPNKCVEKNEPTNFFFKQIIDFVYQGQKVYLFRPSYTGCFRS